MEPILVKHLNELPQAAELVLQLLSPAGTVAFYGEMGAGKTTLIREICSRLGVEDQVNSPTFSIVNPYRTAEGETIYHFDFYRLERPEEALDFGYEEYLYGGCRCLIEWPEKVESLLPEDCDRVYITQTPAGIREIRVNS